MSEEHSFHGITLHCGWGRLIFAHTFPSPESVVDTILEEKEGQRDIAFYLNDPHLVLNLAPQHLFLDPSITYRLQFEDYQSTTIAPLGFEVGPVKSKEEIKEINRIYISHKMVPVDVDYVWENKDSEKFSYFVARANDNQRILGAVLGVDHLESFQDIQNGCSLWALAVDKQAELPGIGEHLVRHIIVTHQGRGRTQLDLSVMHDNNSAIQLYDKLGFKKVAVFAVKCRNSINERLFVGEPPDPEYNPYATIIINEALRRGIRIIPTDPGRGLFTLALGGRSIACWESLTEMTTAIAMVRCADKALTRSILKGEGLRVPAQQSVTSDEQDEAFLKQHKRIVVKPAQGEQGTGVFVDLSTKREMEGAIRQASQLSDNTIIEQFVEGQDLRIIVINYEVVAAAIRKPAEVVGTGKHTVGELIERLSRRRKAATGGESSIPMDEETLRCVEQSGCTMDTVLETGRYLVVRKAANLHTGGTIHDVTEDLHPSLAEAAVRGAKALSIPVVGFDFIVPEPTEDEYVIIEANERPGLANHEPQPTAQKFIDLLFPQAKESPA